VGRKNLWKQVEWPERRNIKGVPWGRLGVKKQGGGHLNPRAVRREKRGGSFTVYVKKGEKRKASIGGKISKDSNFQKDTKKTRREAEKKI